MRPCRSMLRGQRRWRRSGYAPAEEVRQFAELKLDDDEIESLRPLVDICLESAFALPEGLNPYFCRRFPQASLAPVDYLRSVSLLKIDREPFMSSAARRALAAYGAVHTQTVADGADPATLVRLLFDGAIDALLDAEGCIVRNHRQSKAKALQKATEIVLALKTSLNAGVRWRACGHFG